MNIYNNNWKSNEVLLSDLLKERLVEKGDIEDLRELYKDVVKLEKLIVKCGKLKIGNNKFRNIYSNEVERLIINVILRWRVIKFGI